MTDAERIVATLDLPTKVRLLSGADKWHLEGVPSAGLAPIMVADGPHGLRKQTTGGDQLGLAGAVPATCFPTAVTLGATWDVALVREVGAALGREARAEQVSVLLGPGLNLKRHPAGGRNFEYLSEDPVLAGRLAGSLVRGIQSEGVGACLKHLAANHQETFRMVVDTIVDERTLRELELTGFELAVREGRPWTVMSAYNRLNGTYCSDHRWLLTDVLRDQWGFDGLVMTDWGGMNDRVAATEAGCDLEMPGSGKAFDDEVLQAVAEGRLDEDAVDACAVRVVELLIRAGANRDPDATYDADAHHALARRVAAAGTVLLTNDQTLPLVAAGGAAPARLALVGAFAARPRFQGAGSSQVTPTRLDDLRTALPAALPDTEVAYAAGYDPATGATSDHLVAEAVAAATAAEVAVVVAGLPGSYESEGFDREHLALPPGHTRLIEAVLATGTPTVVVLLNGAPVVLPWADRAAAIVEAYLGGQAGGSALADVLTGAVEPGGRLAESFPVAVADLPAHTGFAAHPKQVVHREGLLVGYRFHTTAGVPAAFPFGHGLGYTTIELSDVEVTGAETDREVHVTARNTGGRPGSEVVQVYLSKVGSVVWRPAQELAAFAKVHLDAGEEQRVTLALDHVAFRVYDVADGSWKVEAGTYEVRVGRSSVDLAARITIEVDPGDHLTPGTVPAGLVPTLEELEALLGHPVPDPDPVQPFTRNTPVADLATTTMGAQVRKAVLAMARRQVEKEVPADDESMRRMFASVLEEAPLRAISLLGEGRPPLRWIDLLVDVLNGRVSGRLSELLGQLRP
ncbi:MAG: glycoside hydrolase family 3 C-terminal domain-containing protein [Nitriliruptoraceae bacterium]